MAPSKVTLRRWPRKRPNRCRLTVLVCREANGLHWHMHMPMMSASIFVDVKLEVTKFIDADMDPLASPLSGALPWCTIACQITRIRPRPGAAKNHHIIIGQLNSITPKKLSCQKVQLSKVKVVLKEKVHLSKVKVAKSSVVMSSVITSSVVKRSVVNS